MVKDAGFRKLLIEPSPYGSPDRLARWPPMLVRFGSDATLTENGEPE